MKTIQIIVILSLFVFIGQSQQRFCFPVCSQCDGPAYNQCRGNGCKGGTSFVKGTVTGSNFDCIKASYTYYSTGAKWEPTAVSADVPSPTPYSMNTTINITLSTLTLSMGTAKPCSNGWTSYTFFGGLTGPDVLTINHPGVSGNVFYWQVRIIYGIITQDNWNTNTLITTTFDTNLTSLPNPSTPVQLGNTRSKVCNSNNRDEIYKVVIHTWTHTDPTPLDFSIKTSQTDPTKMWGVMNVIVTVRLCHPYCTICTGDSYINVCTACNYVDQMAKLSGSTCNLTCAIGYGDQTLDPSVCIICQPQCRYCTDLAETCLDCTYPLLLFENTATNFSCISECPQHYYPDRTANDTCFICDISCQNCTTLPTKCTSCYPGTYLYNFQCINPCPAEFYADDPTLTCKQCNKYCFTCAVSSTNCSVCDTTGPWISYLKLPNTCTINCGDGFFSDTNNNLGPNLCLPCDTKCLTCAINSTYCFTCNTTYYLLDNTCGPTCPFPEYFPDNATWKCLSCATYCVNMTMDVYWKNSLREELVCDLTFTQDLSWGPAEIERFLEVTVNDPLISIDSFNLVYEAVAPNLMRLTLSPKGYAFIYNATFNFKTIPLQNGNYDYAANMYRFSDLNYNVSGTMVWFLIKAPSLSDTEKKIMDSVSGVSTQVLSATTLPYVQQIKKAGVFAMLMGGAQITSTACLVNSIPSQNFYQGVRFWAAFVFFDVPPWQEDSKKSKYVVVPNVHDLIKDARLLQNDNYVAISNRTLFETSKINWRFLRTGHTSFFIFDTYINLFLMVLCWILLAISHYCIQLKNYKKRLVSSFYSFTLKIHEISIFYISLATMLQWIYFDAASLERWISFGFCILFNVYFLVYELYIYYDMINYPAAVIGNSRYDYYCVRYGSLLKNIRFVQYDPRQDWSFRHWFRPYNYHILSYYKKFLMMITLPIFYSTKNAQIIVLMIIQLFQIIRFIIVWPFKSKVRNIIRLGLQFILMVFFMSIIIQTSQITEIMINNPQTLQKAVDIFYKIGWLGFAACWIFNIGHIIIFIYDTIIGLRRTNRQMMDQSRKLYYMEKLSSYQEENQDVPLHLVNRWVKLGNLNDRKLQQLPDLNLRVEYFRIQKTRNGFEIDMKKLFEVFMNIEFNYQKENNLTTGKKINKRLTLTRSLSPTFYGIIENLYNKYMANFDFEFMTIKTFQKVNQSEHKSGQQIHLNPKIMKQRILIQTIAGQKRVFHMQKLLPGFPLTYDDLKHLV